MMNAMSMETVKLRDPYVIGLVQNSTHKPKHTFVMAEVALVGWDCNALHRSQFVSNLQTQKVYSHHCQHIAMHRDFTVRGDNV